jgi:hypothetical protein
LLYRIAGILLLAAALTGCYQPDDAVFDQVATQRNVEVAKRLFSLLQARDFDAIDALLDPRLKHPDTRQALETLADKLPPGEPSEIEVVGVQSQGGDMPMVGLTLEYRYPTAWELARVTFNPSGPSPLVMWLNVEPEAQSVGDVNRFTFEGKTWRHYSFLLLALAGPLICLGAFYQWLRTPTLKFRWVWLPLIFLSVGRMTVAWTSGLTFSTLLSASFMTPGVTTAGHRGPILISMAFPIGAAAFLVLRKKLSGTGAPKPKSIRREPGERIEPT